MAGLIVIARRIAGAILTVTAVVVLNFLLIHAAPGDPVTVLAGEQGQMDPAFMAELRGEFGLDRPLAVQLWAYLREAALFQLGTSYRQGRPVISLILERLPATLLLTGAALAVALVLGVSLGALAALRAGRWPDIAAGALSLLFFAVPTFWMGMVAVLLFSTTLEWLPAYGMETVGAGLDGWAYGLDVARHLVLPAFCLGLFHFAAYLRVTRNAVLDAMLLDHVRTAKARGVPERRIWRRHILPHGMLPVITLAGIQVGQLAGGAVLTETVFAWPGVGRLAFDALLQRDYPLLLGIFYVTSVMVVAANLAMDLCRAVIDPRSRAER